MSHSERVRVHAHADLFHLWFIFGPVSGCVIQRWSWVLFARAVRWFQCVSDQLSDLLSKTGVLDPNFGQNADTVMVQQQSGQRDLYTT